MMKGKKAMQEEKIGGKEGSNEKRVKLTERSRSYESKEMGREGMKRQERWIKGRRRKRSKE